MKRLRIENAWICSVIGNNIKPVFGDLIVDNGKISEIISRDFKSYLNNNQRPHKNAYNAAGRVVTVPLVNFHDHFYSRLAKGLNIKGSTDSFIDILKYLWWKLDRVLTMEMVEASAQLSVIEAIKSGATYIFDHHASMSKIENSLQTIANVVTSSSLRGVLCFETTDRNGAQIAENSLNENLNFFTKNSSDNIKSMIGLHASFTLSDDSLEQAAKLVEEYNLGIHIHLCEDSYDRVLSREVTGSYPVQRLDSYNLLNEKSILAHGIYLTKKDCQIIDERGSSIAFNIDSNLNNNVGTPDFIGFPQSIPILMGTDGMHGNPNRTLKNTFLLSRSSDYTFNESFQLLNKIYFDQINFVRKYFDDYPSLKIKDRADFVIWDYVPPAPLNKNNFWGHYLYGITERSPYSVIQNGEFLLKDNQLQNLDEIDINKFIFSQGQSLANKFNRMK